MSSPKSKTSQLGEFIEDLNEWVLNIMSGDLSSRIQCQTKSEELKTLCSNLNIVSEMFFLRFSVVAAENQTPLEAITSRVSPFEKCN